MDFKDEKCLRCIIQKDEMRKGVEKYLKIMELFKNTNNVSMNKDFQREFNGFYRVRRNEQFRKKYYFLMEKNKGKKLNFKEILHELRKFGKLEASFTSKLIATIEPDLPIWDKFVLGYFGLKSPSCKLSDNERLDQAVITYDKIKEKYNELIKKEEGQLMIKIFDEYYLKNNITSIKKMDFFIWQARVISN